MDGKWRLSEPQAGQYWLATASGISLWPVLICDEDLIQTFFSCHWRPWTACQADGSWKPGLQDGGILVGDRTFPALFLGHMRLFWVSMNKLAPIDFELATKGRQHCNDEKLNEALGKIHEQSDWCSLPYWKGELLAHRVEEAKKLSLEAQEDYKFILQMNYAISELGRLQKHLDRIPAYVGHERVVFNIPQSSVFASPILQSYLTKNGAGKPCFEGPLLSSITQRQFRPISVFLNDCDSLPSLLVLPADTKTPIQLSIEMVWSMVTYRGARAFQIPALQRSAVSKVKALEPFCRHAVFLHGIEAHFTSAFAVGSAAAAAAARDAAGAVAPEGEHHHHLHVETGKVEAEFRGWVATRIAAMFWDLGSEETDRLQLILGQNEMLGGEVFKIMSTEVNDKAETGGDVDADVDGDSDHDPGQPYYHTQEMD